jgi:putative flippase GtrA
MSLRRHATFLRFVIAGGVNTLFGWVIYAAAILSGAQPWLALIVSTVTGIGFNFVSLGAYAFRDMALKRLPRFVLSYGFIYASNLMCLKWLRPWIEQPIWAQLILTPPMAILSYLLLSRLVFTGPRVKT